MNTPIKQHQLRMDYITEEAVLRGIRGFNYNQEILQKEQDLEQLRDLMRKNNILEPKALKDLETQISEMTSQSREWIRKVGYTDFASDYVITVFIEQVKTKT